MQWLTAARESGDAQWPSWAAFKVALQQRFLLESDEEYALGRLTQLQQTHSVASYNNIFAGIVQYLPSLTEVSKIHHYIRGLQPQIKQQVQLARAQGNIPTLQVAQKVAQATADVLNPGQRGRGQQQQQQRHRGAHAPPAAQQQQSQQGPDNMELGQQQHARSRGPCWDCGGPHLKRECTASAADKAAFRKKGGKGPRPNPRPN